MREREKENARWPRRHRPGCNGRARAPLARAGCALVALRFHQAHLSRAKQARARASASTREPEREGERKASGKPN